MVPYFPDFLPNVESLVRGWLLALALHLAVTYTSEFIRENSFSNEDMLARNFENRTSLTGWLSFAGENESSFFLVGLRCTHCTFEDLHNAEAEAELSLLR